MLTTTKEGKGNSGALQSGGLLFISKIVAKFVTSVIPVKNSFAQQYQIDIRVKNAEEFASISMISEEIVRTRISIF